MIEELKNSVLKVGDGRGFLTRIPRNLLIATAAHCLPHLPPAHAAAYNYERTYKLLGSLHDPEPSILAECWFVDPVGDIAVLGSADVDETEDYQDLIEDMEPFKMGEARPGMRVWMLSLAGEWFPGEVKSCRRALTIESKEMVASGMSGSPIITDEGVAVGLISGGSHGNPHLPFSLPGWMLREDLWK
jgi:hypothetical protein